MEDRHFPLFISSLGRHAVVFGGGNIAQRRVETLLQFSFSVTVVSPSLTAKLQEAARKGEIEYIDGRYSEKYLAGSYLVIACTNDRQVNRRIGEDARERDLHVSVCDSREECTFFFPAVVKKGDVSIGVNTAGKSPVVSSRVRRKVEAAIPDYYGELTTQLGQLREYVKDHVSEESARRAILKQAAAEAFSHERTLSPEEIHSIIRQVLNHGTISGRPVGH